MADRLIGRINPSNQILNATISSPRSLAGGLNIYTMMAGDGREIELCIIDSYFCWRRLGDINWIQLFPLSDIKGDTPQKGIDYFTQEDIDFIIPLINNSIGNQLEELATKEELRAIVPDKKYTHNQSSASSIWTIQHNLNKFPAVVCVDSAGSVVVGDIKYIDRNQIIITFIGAFSGKAYLN